MKTELEKRFELEGACLPEVRNRFNARVVRWVYSLAEIWSWEDRRKKGTDDNLLPGPDGAFYACGYDDADKPIVLYDFGYETVYKPVQKRIPLKEKWVEEFITHSAETLEVIRFIHAKLERVSQLTFQNNRVTEVKSVNQGVYQHALIHYQGSRRKLEQSLNSKGEVFFEIEFDPNGQQSYYRIRRDGTRVQLYQPLPKGITVKSIKDTVHQRLLALIPELVAAASIREPICCVALAYDDEGNDSLPPVIGIGLKSERQQWVVEHGKRAKDFVWNPAQFSNYEKAHTQLNDDALEEACDYLNGKWAESGAAAPAARLLMEVAAALNKIDWPPSIQRTDDFVVYAVGLEGRGLRKSLKAGLSPEKFVALKSKCLL